VAEAARRLTGLTVAVNEPYSAADGVTHTLALHATPYRLPNVMLEIRNDLIATPDAETAMAATLSLALGEALDRISAASRGAA
jgi:predicted N-formylglutamate amidohydrolase